MESKTKKKLGAAGASVAVVGAAIALTAGTFSYFSAEGHTSVQGSTGSLSIGQSVTGSFSAPVGPGRASGPVTFKYTNTGNLPAKLYIQYVDQGASTQMRNNLMVSVNGRDPESLKQLETSTNANAYGYPQQGTLDPGDSATFKIKVKLDPSGESQNNLQGKTVKEKVVARLFSLDDNGDPVLPSSS